MSQGEITQATNRKRKTEDIRREIERERVGSKNERKRDGKKIERDGKKKKRKNICLCLLSMSIVSEF